MTFDVAGDFDVMTPIACTLTTDDRLSRREEWRTCVMTMVVELKRPNDRQLRMRLAPSVEVLAAVVTLAQREKQCCAFFAFDLEILGDALWLVISVPAEAVDVLNEFASLRGKDSTC